MISFKDKEQETSVKTSFLDLFNKIKYLNDNIDCFKNNNWTVNDVVYNNPMKVEIKHHKVFLPNQEKKPIPSLNFNITSLNFNNDTFGFSNYDLYKTPIYEQYLMEAIRKEHLNYIIKENREKMSELNINHDRYTYKAKRKNSNDWVYGNYVTTTINGNNYFYILPKDDDRWIEIDKLTLCQCTGLFTVTGYPLYEHDIVVDKYDRVFEIVRECDIVGGNKTVTAFILCGMVECMKDICIAIEDVLNDNGDIELSVIDSNC